MAKLLMVIGIAIISFALSPFGPLAQFTIDGSTDLSSHVGLGANDSLVIPPVEIKETIEHVQSIEKTQVDIALKQQRWSDYLLTLVVVLSGLVSIAAGYQRILKKQDKSDFVVVACIALLSAGVAISTSVAGRIENLAKTRLSCIDQVKPLVRQTVADVEGTRSEIQARVYLDDLRSAADRCDT